MTHRRERPYQTLDPFAALGIYQVQRVEQTVQDHLAAQAWRAESRWAVGSVARAVGVWLRQRGPAFRRSPRRYAAQIPTSLSTDQALCSQDGNPLHALSLLLGCERCTPISRRYWRSPRPMPIGTMQRGRIPIQRVCEADREPRHPLAASPGSMPTNARGRCLAKVMMPRHTYPIIATPLS
jgi:hypothetical protein